MLDVRRRSVTIGGLEHGYLDVGSSNRDPIVLLHDGAFGSDALSCWEPVLAGLSQHYWVLAPDLTGYGRSPKVFHFDMDARTQRLHYIGLFCEWLDVGPAALVGASFGGSLALQAAIERSIPITAAVSICGTGGLLMNETKFRTLASFVPGEPIDEIVNLLMRTPPGGENERRREAASSLAHWKTLRAPSLAAPNAQPTPPPERELRYRESLGTILAPTLLLAGGEDELLARGWEQELASIIPRARAKVIPGSRHFPQIDQPEATVSAILEFLGN